MTTPSIYIAATQAGRENDLSPSIFTLTRTGNLDSELIRVEGDVTISPLSYELYMRLSPHTAQVILRLYGALPNPLLNTFAVYRLRRRH